ncbi:HAMP domain-containing protein [Pseudomonas sp. Q2-TVG4-2]|uniref:HAMP domain-containing protein n=1 Tax=Pseudomonas sp. Q2-TVG4-2 TaxID=1685699 RepID=UPI0015E79869|nr:HAMP domain-containing protein [Pseudomonas sp. Q2-TVG4-2]
MSTEIREQVPEGEFDRKLLLAVLIAVKKGDFSARMPMDWTGVDGKIADVLNDIIELNENASNGLARLSEVVGREGKLSERLSLGSVNGGWARQVESINTLVADLGRPSTEMARVIGAVAKGDLTQRMVLEADGMPMQGEFMRTAKVVNTMVEQLASFASEVTRVAREVGTDGKLGGQAQVAGVAGTWKDLTDNVNAMAGNLTVQLRDVSKVATAIGRGDLSQKVTVEVKGEILQIKDVVNTMVEQLSSFASEVTRVAREVGTDGKLGGQAQVAGVSGTWKDLTDNVNSMASNLTGQVRNIALVTTAVAHGDLSKQITVEAKGEISELKNTINGMVQQLGSFASEVTRVAREVGTEGKLGGQAQVAGVSGTWKDLTDNVNSMASNLTGQVRNIAEVTTAVANGDLSKKITVDVKGEILELKNTINTMVDQLGSFASEVTRVAREVGTEGKLGGQAQVVGVAGTWKDLTENVNQMAGNLTGQVRNIALVTTAVANGDLSKQITVEAKGEISELKNTINGMVEQLRTFAAEVTRVARDVGTEGKLGGQAQVAGVAGTWKDLTDNVNLMATNLTDQVRGIARVVTAVANGDLKKKLSVEAKGEIAALADTINSLIDTLATFTDQVTSVAREVGVEGKLGGQAKVPGAAGTWKDLTENVNQLAANLTTQVRAIAEVATAVTKGDLTRSIRVAAEGEVAMLKDNINEMIFNLKETTDKSTEQDWLKTNLARFTRLLQGQRDMLAVCKLILSELSPLVNSHHGAFYGMKGEGEEALLTLQASYAYRERKHLSRHFRLGEGLVGECALENERILLTNVPSDYVQISSGLGEAPPLNIVVLPVMFEGMTKAVIELASFERFSPTHLAFLEQLTESIGIVLNNIEANSRTEALLQQSQKMAYELQSQQEELQQTNEELEEKARLLAEQNAEVERKNEEVELAKRSLEEKAAQLSLTSKYKSEFLANMSHELRTPLNSLLLLAEQLKDNPEQNLSDKEVEYAGTIFGSGNDLLNLINDILDLSKIESGMVAADIDEVPFAGVRGFVEQTFRHIAEDKRVEFAIDLAKALPSTLFTDERRLKQILKNLLSNAFKFTSAGSVSLEIQPATVGWTVGHPTLDRAATVVAFAVSDTGIGIAPEKQGAIFEAFQQADGTTSRRYGGTGLGLAISRELAALLGGEITLRSTPGVGSVFTLYLPLHHIAPPGRDHDHSPMRVSGPVPDMGKRGNAGAGIGWPAVRAYQGEKDDVSAPLVAVMVDDDRFGIAEGDRVMLIIEDDPHFGRILRDFAKERGFKALVALQGQNGLALARQYRPDAITLDIQLPDMSGWAVLDQLKHDSATRHIPVHVISVDGEEERGRSQGALATLAKPADEAELSRAFARIDEFLLRKVKNLLVLEGDLVERERIINVIGNGDVKITTAINGTEAFDKLRQTHFDCMVLDPGSDDGFEVIEKIKADPDLRSLPIVVYTARELTGEEAKRLQDITGTPVLKDVNSPERLLDEVTLFLHRVEADLPEPKQKILEQVRKIDPLLRGRKVLVVDDDVRNIFSLNAVLERHHIQVVSAENGKDGIALLKETPDIDLVLMDIMMPEMDGYETMRAIRKLAKFKSLPIIALTAKAMMGDREKCIEAGASDYVSKPVQTEQLLSLLRVWLYSRARTGVAAAAAAGSGGCRKAAK